MRINIRREKEFGLQEIKQYLRRAGILRFKVGRRGILGPKVAVIESFDNVKGPMNILYKYVKHDFIGASKEPRNFIVLRAGSNYLSVFAYRDIKLMRLENGSKWDIGREGINMVAYITGDNDKAILSDAFSIVRRLIGTGQLRLHVYYTATSRIAGTILHKMGEGWNYHDIDKYIRSAKEDAKKDRSIISIVVAADDLRRFRTTDIDLIRKWIVEVIPIRGKDFPYDIDAIV